MIKLETKKVLVVGSFNSGKSSFIHSASTKAVSVDRLGTTIALDHGHCKHNDTDVELFGTPGQERFDPVLKILGGQSLGLIIVVSATDPTGFERARDMAKKAGQESLPFIVVANKADLRGALPNASIKSSMSLPENVAIVRTTAKDLTKVQPGLPCELKKEEVDKALDEILKIMKKPE